MHHLSNYYQQMEEHAQKAVDALYDSIPDEYKFNEIKVLGLVMRSVRGKAHPQYVQEAVRTKIKGTLRDMAIRILNNCIRERDGLLGMSEAQGWHYVKWNMMEALREGTKSSLPLDALMTVVDEAIAECIKANQGDRHEVHSVDARSGSQVGDGPLPS